MTVMAIRSAAKAVIIKDGKVLLNRCRHRDGREYHDLPGGGQKQFEPLEDAVRREVMEETGYTVGEMRFAAIAEDIYSDEFVRREYPDYSHRVFHIFAATITDAPRNAPSEIDWGMETSVWIDADKVKDLPETFPDDLGELVANILRGGAPMWLGTAYR